MTHIVLSIAYDGSSYYGWQKTRAGASIESKLQETLETIFQEQIDLRAASRTDKGVHAEGQVVDFFTRSQLLTFSKLKVSLNQLLPPDIRCLGVSAVDSFHPTLDARRKTYRYSISTGSVQLPRFRHSHWHVRDELSKELLEHAAKLVCGTHDFRGFCNRRADLNETDTIRTIFQLEIIEDVSQNALLIDIVGDHFLYKMARNIVGTLVWIAKGKLPVAAIETAFATRQRSFAGVTAPAHGLTLRKVFYDLDIFYEQDKF